MFRSLPCPTLGRRVSLCVSRTPACLKFNQRKNPARRFDILRFSAPSSTNRRAGAQTRRPHGVLYTSCVTSSYFEAHATSKRRRILGPQRTRITQDVVLGLTDGPQHYNGSECQSDGVLLVAGDVHRQRRDQPCRRQRDQPCPDVKHSDKKKSRDVQGLLLLWAFTARRKVVQRHTLHVPMR